MTGTDLFTHIRHMLWTTIPSMGIALVAFFIIGLSGDTGVGSENMDEIFDALGGSFNIGFHLLIPPAVVLFLVMRKMPAFPALLIGALLGAVWACLFQSAAVLKLAGDSSLGTVPALIKGAWIALFQGYTSQSGNVAIDELLTRGGMASMLNTVWLILSAMMFGGVMEKTRMLETIAGGILRFAQSTGSLIVSTLVTSIGMNIVASDQYIAIVLPGKMFKAEFKRRNLDPKNLSRVIEDAGTLTSPLVPWNTCGAYMAGTLGVATFAYLPFAFFNLINPLVSILYGFTGFTISRVGEDEAVATA